tara:strand:- start:1199 stop:1528 length:330 start_codon:yes stop_codon:yes gene_type:complete
MSIFDNLLGSSLKESEKINTARESLNLIEQYIGEEDKILMDLQSHNPYTKFKNRTKMFRFTTKLLSLELINKLAKDKRVKNVYFASRHPHPGGGADSISLRHKIIVEYH